MFTVGREGYTLVELLISLALLGIVSAGIYGVLVRNQQTYLAQTQRIDLQQNIRAAVTLLPAEFRELDATDGDIQQMSDTALTIRAMRQLAIICDQPTLGGAGNIAFTIRQQPLFFALRDFTVTDSLLIYYEGSKDTRADDSWVPAQFVSIVSANCPAPDNAPGWRITATPPTFTAPEVAQTGNISNGAPVRGFEVVRYRLYQEDNGRWYLGQTKGETTQPLIGPLTGSNGVTFRYYSSAGAATAVPTQVASIEIQLRGQTASPIRDATGAGLAYRTDSIMTRVALRNNVRFN
jgi:prepilin-type N-terminal cleavage/methylation domain-containing protein